MSLRFEAWLGVVGIAFWTMIFWLMAMPALAKAWRAWLAFEVAYKGGKLAYEFLFMLGWLVVATALLSWAVHGMMTLTKVCTGQTSPRLARRDFWDFLVNGIFFLKTGMWKS